MIEEDIKNEKDKEKILELYFNRVKSYEEIILYFNNKYTYLQIKRVIKERYDNWGKK